MKSNVKSIYRHHNSLKIYQGDLLRDVNLIVNYDDYDFDEFKMPYCIIMSQDCDLDNDFKSYETYIKLNSKYNLLDLDIDTCSKEDKNNIISMYDKLLPSILVCPVFLATNLREGIHLNNYNNYRMQKINSKNWNNIKNNETPRYHYLKSDNNFQIPDLVIDFKRYYTLPTHYVYSIFKNSYVGSLNELYRERISQRFANYLSRIGLP